MSVPQTLLAERYRLVRMIAAGGMGVVWEAWDERLQRPVAIKELRTQPGVTDEEAEQAKNRAMREARITARLHHPHAVPVFDAVEHDGRPCLVMQYLPSTPLSAILRQRGRLEPHEVARIGAEIASALAAAHKLKIVHRDVKPGNILITDEGTAHISDFGISHALGDATLTRTGMVYGTPAYLAPEVARGGDSTFASDVFSLGSTLYAALEGDPPFGSDPNSIALLHRVASGKMTPPQHAGVLTPFLLDMLSPEPKQRPSMRSIASLLGGLQKEPGSGKPTLPLPLADRSPAAPEPGAALRSTHADGAADPELGDGLPWAFSRPAAGEAAANAAGAAAGAAAAGALGRAGGVRGAAAGSAARNADTAEPHTPPEPTVAAGVELDSTGPGQPTAGPGAADRTAADAEPDAVGADAEGHLGPEADSDLDAGEADAEGHPKPTTDSDFASASASAAEVEPELTRGLESGADVESEAAVEPEHEADVAPARGPEAELTPAPAPGAAGNAESADETGGKSASGVAAAVGGAAAAGAAAAAAGRGGAAEVPPELIPPRAPHGKSGRTAASRGSTTSARTALVPSSPTPTAATPTVAAPTAAAPTVPSPTRPASAADAPTAATTIDAGAPPRDSRRRRRVGMLLLVAAAVLAAILVIPSLFNGMLGQSGQGTQENPGPAAAPQSSDPNGQASGESGSPDNGGTEAPADPDPTEEPAPEETEPPEEAPREEPEDEPDPEDREQATTPEGAVIGYYALLPGDTDEAWERLTADYQQGEPINRDYFEEFWDGFDEVTVSDVTRISDTEVEATVTYIHDDGRQESERRYYRFVEEDGILKIDASST